MSSQNRKLARLFIANISSKTENAELQDILQAVGKLLAFDIDGRQGYIEYENPKDATEAMRRFNRLELNGRTLLVEYAVNSTNRYMQNRRRYGQNDDNRYSRTCYECNQRGHIAKYCPRNRNRSSNRSDSSSHSSHDRKKSYHKKRRDDSSSSSSSNARSRSRSKSKDNNHRHKSKLSKKQKDSSSSRGSSRS